MGTQQFCLRWNNHQSNMLNTFESLLHNEALVDVTLACDGLSLKAHKVVLSACSPYFQSLFIENPCKHPIVILKDVRYTDLKALVDFMYKGEVNVSQEQLNALLNTAEALKIKGLAEVTGGGFSCVNSTQLEPLSLSRTQGPRDPPTPPLVDSRRSQPPPLPHLQPLPNPPGMVPMAPSSPPPKRRKTKPRKRIPESAIISDQEDSDAVDLVTTTPEMIETCVDIPESSSEGERAMEPTETKNIPLLEQSRSNEAENSQQQHPPPSLPPPPPPPPPLPSSAIACAEGTEDRSPLGETKGFHKLFSNTNQNLSSSACVSSPSTLPTQRLPMLSKSSLISVLPPSSSSPVPSTSTTQATIQDIRRLCHFTRQSQKHKSPWTEEDMVAALEAVQCGRLTYALAARKFDIPKATLHYYVILMKAVEAVRSGRMTPEIAAIKYNVRASILIGCLFGTDTSFVSSSPLATGPAPDKNDFSIKKEVTSPFLTLYPM